LFLSFGYSACHWCHVMERESFENDDTAAILNRELVSIKVGRGERPDIDSIYMQAVQMMTGHGGWPMSMFLTPSAVPFFGGTYFPPEDRHGMPGFSRVLEHVAGAFRERRQEVEAASEEVRQAISSSMRTPKAAQPIDRDGLDLSAGRTAASDDSENGWLTRAEEFPPVMS